MSFRGVPAADISWIDGTHFATARSGDWVKVDATNGTETPLFDAEKMGAALAGLPGVNAGEARTAARSRSLVFNTAHTAAIARLADDLYGYSFDGGRAVRLTNAPGHEDHASFSPDGKLVAFMRQQPVCLRPPTRREIADRGRRREDSQRPAGLGLRR